MKKEMKIEELLQGFDMVSKALKQGAPIKTPLISTLESITAQLDIAETSRKAIMDKYLKLDSEGNPIPKADVDAPKLITDYELKDEVALTAELDALEEKLFEVEFFTVNSDKTILIKRNDGSHDEMLLTDYLEMSADVDGFMFKFINEYFIND